MEWWYNDDSYQNCEKNFRSNFLDQIITGFNNYKDSDVIWNQ